MVDDNFLTPSELNLFLKKAKERISITMYTLFLLLAYSDLRKGRSIWFKMD